MLTVILIDDEEDCITSLRNFITRYCLDVTIVAEAHNVREATEQIKQLSPDIVFLDINMPHEDGFTLFEKIPAPTFHTIFVTGYDEYALKAIKHNALDYILKPVNINELIGAIDRAKALLHKNILSTQLNALMQSVRKIRPQEKICLPLSDGFIYVQSDEIIRCEALGSYTNFHFTNRPVILTCKALGSYETLLKDYGFIRVHSKHLINRTHIEKYQRGRGGIITMSDQTEIIVSQRKRDDFLKQVNNETRDDVITNT